MPLYTPLSGSWLNRAESVQRIIARRALAGQHPQTAQQVIDWLEQTVAGWNEEPTPFVCNGKRRRRREREACSGQQRWQARTPAIAAGLTDHLWTVRDLLTTVVLPTAINME